MGPGKAEKSTPVASKSIETGAAVSCRGIHALSGLRCAGFEHLPFACGARVAFAGTPEIAHSRVDSLHAVSRGACRSTNEKSPTSSHSSRSVKELIQ